MAERILLGIDQKQSVAFSYIDPTSASTDCTMARVPNEIPRRYDQHITVFIRSTRGLQDNWLRHIVSRLTGTNAHMMIHNVEETPEERNRLALDPGGDNEIVSIHTVTHSQGTIRCGGNKRSCLHHQG